MIETIGDCTLILGDCKDYLSANADRVADVLFTDPPYRMEIHGRGLAKNLRYFKNLNFGTSLDFVLADDFLDRTAGKLSEANLLFFCNKLMKFDLTRWALDRGMTFDELVLAKEVPMPLTNNQWLPDKEFALHIFRNLKVRGNYKTKRTFFLSSNFKQTECDHPSVKPLFIVKAILDNISERGQTIIDPFIGSGTTGVACAQMGRKFIGIEIDQKYFDIACRRIDAAVRQGDWIRDTSATETGRDQATFWND